MNKTEKIFIGTSGWMYDDWQGNFYPATIKKAAWLKHYQNYFSTVEVNNTFYQSPTKKKLSSWKKKVPKDFIFSIKANRYITHIKNLSNPQQPVDKLISTIKTLDNKLGPVLFQLPPHWHVNKKRLNSFLNVLPKAYQYVFEFRHSSWYTDEIYNLLNKHNCAFCVHDHQDAPSPFKTTAEFAYLRFHGPKGNYQSKYNDQQVKDHAQKIKKLIAQNIAVYVYYNNDFHGYAVKNAKQLQNLLE